jgi:hypothetical protein
MCKFFSSLYVLYMYIYIYINNFYIHIYIYTYMCVVLSSAFYIVLNDSIVSKTIIRRTSAHEENIARIFIVVVVVVIIIVIHRFDRHSRHIDMSVCISALERKSVVQYLVRNENA